MYKYVFRQYIRGRKALIKNYYAVGTAVLSVLAFFVYTIITGIQNSDITPEDNIIAICFTACAVQLLCIVFQKTPVFMFHPAIMIHTFNTERFRSMKAFLFLKKIVTKLLISAALCLFVYSFKLSAMFFMSTAVFCSYFLSCSLLRWAKCNGKMAVSLCFYAACSLAFVLSFSFTLFFAIALFALLGAIVIFVSRVDIDWGGYYEDILYRARINHASNHNNIAEMQQITTEHVANQKHMLKLYHLPIKKSNAILCKAIIETFRMSKQVIIVFVMVLAFAIILNVTNFFWSIPVIGDPASAKIIGAFCISIFTINLKEIYSKQIRSLWDKHRNGLFIPYKSRAVVFSYAFICCVIVTIVNVACCFILGSMIYRAIIAVVASNLLIVGSIFLSKQNTLTNKIPLLATNALFFATSWLLF